MEALMRRKDREITDIDAVFDVVDRCGVLRLGMVDHGKPYVVALNYGYERDGDALILYFHSARAGRKIDVLKDDPSVFFEMDCDGRLVPGTPENPCKYGWHFDSVTGSGEVEFVEDDAEKAHALDLIIGQAEGRPVDYSYPEASLRRTCIGKIRSTDIAGKHYE